MTPSIEVRINGEPREIPQGTTISALLALLRVTAERVAVEVNTRVVAKALHGSTELRPDDEVEVVTFVGGG